METNKARHCEESLNQCVIASAAKQSPYKFYFIQEIASGMASLKSIHSLAMTGGILICILVSGYVVVAQPSEKEQQAIMQEGFELYHLELASWNSSDLLMSIWGISTLDSIEGYLSYRQLNSYNTIYYGGEKNFRIYAHFVFDSVSSMESAFMDVTPRPAGKKETELIALRKDALERIGKNENNFFETVEKVSLNLIPVINGNMRKVVVISGPQETGNVLFGNDYVLEYSAENKFVAQTKLHSNLIPVPMETEPGNGNEFITLHTHHAPTSEYVTATDICTLLLYGDYTNWEQHVVISDNFVSIWDVKGKTLKIISRKEFDKKEKEKKD